VAKAQQRAVEPQIDRLPEGSKEAVWKCKYFLIRIVEGGVQPGALGSSATNCPIVPARLIMRMENLVE
jgi:hypothetical protein